MSEESRTNRGIKEKILSVKRNKLILVICSVIILLLVIFLLVRGGDGAGKNDVSETSAPAEAYAKIGDSDISNVNTDAKENEPWSTMTDEQYGIEIGVLENGYTGPFVEDGSDDDVDGVFALTFTNNSSQDIQYGEYVFSIDGEVASFKFSNLPAGDSCLVLEAERHQFDEKEVPSLVSRVVAQTEELTYAREELLVVDNSDNTITIMNLTEKELPVARVFYKNYDNEQNMFIGGITYTAKVENISAGKGVTVTPEHFQSGNSVVVGSGLYDE